MTDALKICHDRILPQDLARPLALMDTGPGLGKPKAIFPNIRKLWMNGSTLRVSFMGGSEAQRKVAREQAAWWSKEANLEFLFVNDPHAEIRISFDGSDGAWSYIGTDCVSIPKNQATMNLGFLDGGTAAHEFGHAIGLGHEHQNPEGGIEWNEEVVIRDLSGPPNNWDEEQIRHNVLEKYQVNSYLRGSHFDPESIMLYAFPGSWTKSGIGTEANEVLSPTDLEFVTAEGFYPGKKRAEVMLEVNGAPAMAEIGELGEEDIFQFTAGAARRYVIETGGQTDVVMKLFGPNSRTQLVAEDDDGGEGFNARIVTRLVAGLYYVQIRHYNKAGGTGKYSVSVKT